MLNKKTGFWIRFLGRIIDLVLISLIIISSAFLMLNHDDGWKFKEDWLFYIWDIELIVVLGFWFLFIPIVWGGKTAGMWMVRIKIIFDDPKHRVKSILKREIFFSINWIISSILIGIVINHTLIIKFSLTNQDSVVLNNFEKLRIGIMTSVGTILTVIQFIYIISIFVRGESKGLHDTQSKTWTVWINKFSNQETIKEEIKIKPRAVENNPVIWVE